MDESGFTNARRMLSYNCEFGEGHFLFQYDWPTQSPDLNPIEHLCDELECRLQARTNRPTSVPDLTEALVAEWKQVPAVMFRHLVEGLPRSVEAIIAAKWGFWNEMFDDV
jgi:hypothetical protein